MYKVAAYITAYEDLLSAKACLTSLNNQSYPIETILIVDNSKKKLELLLDFPNIIIKHHPENIGVAGGLNIAIQWAIENDYDFLWTFDQDSQPLSTTLAQLLTTYQELTKQGLSVGIIAPTIIDIQTNRKLQNGVFNKYKFRWIFSDQPEAKQFFKLHTDNLYECDVVITSGSLVNLNAAKNIPLPNTELFIDAVDWDYCMKMKAQGFSIIVADDAIVNHTFGQYKTLLQNSPVYNYSALRYYYIIRNHTFIETRLSAKNNLLLLSLFYRLNVLLKKCLLIILYEKEQKILKLLACFQGMYDGLLGKLGKTYQPQT